MAMALAPHQIQSKGFYATCTSPPVAWEGTKKLVTYCPVGCTTKCTTYNKHSCLSIVCRTAAGPVLRVKNQCCKVLSFQDVTKKADSNGKEDSESSTQLSSSSAWRGMKEAKQSLQALQRFPAWLNKLQKKNFVLHANEIIQKPVSRLKSLNRDEMIKQSQVEVTQHILKLWQSLEVRTKFSLIIMLLAFIAVTVRYGFQVSGELLPLWIIGPWLITTYIKACMSVFRFFLQIAVNIVKSNFVRGVIHAAATNFIRTKNYLVHFFVHVKDTLVQVPVSLRESFETKWDYIMSGKFKEFLLQRYEESREQLKERMRDAYLDYMEANWPNWRRTQRFLKKLFPK